MHGTMSGDARSATEKPVLFLDTREKAVPQELWAKFPDISTMESRQMTGKLLAFLSDNNVKEYGQIMAWARNNAPRRNEVCYNDLVFAAVCKAACRLKLQPPQVVERVVASRSTKAVLIQDGAFLP